MTDEQYLERGDDVGAWLAEGDAVLAHFDETGLHLTEAEVDRWLSRLERGEEVDPPPCHV